MEPQYVCFEKLLSDTDVDRNLEIPKGARFLPDGNGVMLVTDRDGNTYEFIASVRADGRRSLTHDWHAFAKRLRADELLRIYRVGNGNQYVVQGGLGIHGQFIVWETL